MRTIAGRCTIAYFLLSGRLAAPCVTLFRHPCKLCHTLPLAAWILRIDADQQARQRARLLRLHENPAGWTYEVCGAIFTIDQEEVSGEIRCFDTDLGI